MANSEFDDDKTRTHIVLTEGTMVSHYRIVEKIGAGGMGEVYLAEDTKLNRKVALKFLPPHLSQDPDSRSRFVREAKAISSLNHPNICILYDVGHDNGTDYLVMEYIEGETLYDRIQKGPLDIREALEIAGEVSDALDSAHRQGLVHRDLKPGNVMLTKTGAKLLDFGLAKLTVSEGVVEGTYGITQTTPLTRAGTIIGTLQYMSPEQLEGQQADARSDIFAFGAMLYEMVTGQRAFEGKSQASLIAAIMGKEPTPISKIKPMYPPGLDRLVRKCLAKDPDKRWQSSSDLSDELRWIAQSGSQAGVASAVSAKRRFRFRLAWIIAAVATMAALTLTALSIFSPEPEILTRRFQVDVSPKVTAASWPQISPDGRYIAYKATDSSNTTMIWIRPVNSLESYPLPGTKNSNNPFWSPDSKHLAYTTSGGQLKRISVAGGPAQLLAEVPGAYDGCWGAAGYIILDGGRTDSIRAISASGGELFGVTKIDHSGGELWHGWPWFLPDGKHFFYLVTMDSAATGIGRILKVGSIESDETVSLTAVNSFPRYTAEGYILFMRDRILLAQEFDADNLKLVGEPVPITDDVSAAPSNARADFSVSNEGTLVLRPLGKEALSEIKWFDRSGLEIESIIEPARYAHVAISPDQEWIAYSKKDDENNSFDLWIYNLKRKVSSRLTFEPGNEEYPLWTPDGNKIIYTAEVGGPNSQPYIKAADGSADAEKLPVPDNLTRQVTDISRDGLRTCQRVWINSNNSDIEVLLLSGDSEPVVIAGSEFQERLGKFSPDGNYIAYNSNESGVYEIYVRRSDGRGAKWQISTGGGWLARWREDGKELFYEGNNDLMAVPVNTEGTFEAGTPVKLFSMDLTTIGPRMNNRWDVTPDGQKFLVVTPIKSAQAPFFEVTLNWTQELKTR